MPFCFHCLFIYVFHVLEKHSVEERALGEGGVSGLGSHAATDEPCDLWHVTQPPRAFPFV